MRYLDPEIHFEDAHLLVLDKPAGMLSQSDISGTPSLVDWLRDYFGRHYVGLIHRLDRNTSGIMVIAKRSKSAARLTESLQGGNLKRIYKVWLTGNFKGQGTWRDHLIKDEQRNIVSGASEEKEGAREAVLHLEKEVLGKWMDQPVTLCKMELETGRSHQIRIQSALHGHSVLGDAKYGSFQKEPWTLKFGRPAIHSHRIEFPHPMSGEPCCFEASLPADMKRPLLH